MSTPSKLAVEIAEAVCDRYGFRADSQTHTYFIKQVSALIDDKLAPLVEDGARLDWLLSTMCNESRNSLDHARAQRPAQEGSDKP